ncbi:MAG TPA: protein-glutamate O-methyltransferase CheR [Acidobacteriota bacterium]|nr:protein-glutamate O-methyltransferase CheR [Acidobacteriota bacterium]
MRYLAEIASRLQMSIGSDPKIIGIDSIENAVRERMSGFGLTDMGTYAALLEQSGPEMQALVEKVVVPETWFYRDEEPFRFLARQAVAAWFPGKGGKVFRILSVPCSSGEEPYSIAMTLLDCGLTPDQFHIDAIDISEHALEIARRGLYGRNSFRGDDLAYRSTYFQEEGNLFRLSPAVAGTVQFARGNLLDNSFPHDVDPYQVIFCRNLLIYLTCGARNRAVTVLDRLLADSGLLFVGHAEVLLLRSERLAEVEHPRAFALRRSSAPDNSLPDPNQTESTAQSPDSPSPLTVRERIPIDRVSLDEALREADDGRLSAARRICEKHLSTHGPSAQAYFVLGLVTEAAGLKANAEELFNKTLYLDPSHYEALIHLSLLLRRRDSASSTLLQRRARRVRSLKAS